jgi:hypothetical protein
VTAEAIDNAYHAANRPSSGHLFFIVVGEVRYLRLSYHDQGNAVARPAFRRERRIAGLSRDSTGWAAAAPAAILPVPGS